MVAATVWSLFDAAHGALTPGSPASPLEFTPTRLAGVPLISSVDPCAVIAGVAAPAGAELIIGAKAATSNADAAPTVRISPLWRVFFVGITDK